jgi:hypothetical protein
METLSGHGVSNLTRDMYSFLMKELGVQPRY